ncbi:uncharacterized protein V6R79_020667 [Siganus canaliculatus]
MHCDMKREKKSHFFGGFSLCHDEDEPRLQNCSPPSVLWHRGNVCFTESAHLLLLLCLPKDVAGSQEFSLTPLRFTLWFSSPVDVTAAKGAGQERQFGDLPLDPQQDQYRQTESSGKVLVLTLRLRVDFSSVCLFFSEETIAHDDVEMYEKIRRHHF